jgi:hypothetical protein
MTPDTLIEMKRCKICLINKNLNDFHSCGTYKNKTYYRGECIECNRQKQKAHGKKHTQKYRETEKYKQTKRKFRLTEEQKRKSKEYAQRPEVKARRSYLANIRAKDRYKTDSLFKLKVAMRTRVYKVLTYFKYPKRGSIFKYLGCDIHTLRTHLEIQFKDNMSWDNYGEWHVDHIIPLSSAKNEEELIKLCHYTNLQPLWAIDNLKKSDKIL